MATRTCEILHTQWTSDKDGLEQIVVGTVSITNGKLSFESKSGHKNAMDSVEKESKGKDPTKWFNGLPKHYDGIAVRARIIGESDWTDTESESGEPEDESDES